MGTKLTIKYPTKYFNIEQLLMVEVCVGQFCRQVSDNASNDIDDFVVPIKVTSGPIQRIKNALHWLGFGFECGPLFEYDE